MEQCAFENCKLAEGNPLVALREEDIENLDASQYKTGHKVCAAHFRPHSVQQVNSVRRNGHLLPGAFLGDVNNQYCHDKEKRKKRK